MAEVPIARAFCQTASMTSSLNGFPETSLLGRRCITSTFSRARKCLLFRQCFATQSEDVSAVAGTVLHQNPDGRTVLYTPPIGLWRWSGFQRQRFRRTCSVI